MKYGNYIYSFRLHYSKLFASLYMYCSNVRNTQVSVYTHQVLTMLCIVINVDYHQGQDLRIV